VPPLTDPDRLAAYRDALSNWSTRGYIQFELTEASYRWVRRELGNITLRDIGRLMYEYVTAGGEIDEQLETRENWSEQHEFHHDLRLSISNKTVYIETRLNFCRPVAPDESWINVVNIHER
jgi:hypothetical protein